MVQVVGKEESQVRESSCNKCASRLRYTLSEVQSYISSDYTGGRDTVYYVSCPSCGNKVITKGY